MSGEKNNSPLIFFWFFPLSENDLIFPLIIDYLQNPRGYIGVFPRESDL